MYSNAKKCFKDNTDHMPATSDPANHNLNAGLFQLADSLDSDMSNLKHRLDRIEELLQRLCS